jgi:hypothetical protein
MSREITSIKATSMQRTPLPVSGGAQAASTLPSPILRGGRADPFAVRSALRGPSGLIGLAILQKCAGLVLVGSAWLIFLWGLANLVLAALHNSQGELGMGLDATLMGAKSCLGAFLLAAIGVPQWVMAKRKLGRA